MDWYSAFWLDSDNEWRATHRLPLDSAIYYCQQYKKNQAHLDCRVAIVPDGMDPAPFLQLAMNAPFYGAINADGYLVTTFA